MYNNFPTYPWNPALKWITIGKSPLENTMILVIYQWYLYGSNGGEHTQTTPQPTVDFRNSLHLGVLLDFFLGVYSTGVCWGSISFQAWNKEETPLVPCWSELQEPTNKVGETDNPKLVGGFNPSEKY